MSARRRKFEVWTAISLALFLMFAVFFIYPICTLLRQAFTTKEAAFTLDNFVKFFSKPYYYNTIFNSFKVSLAVMAVSLAIGIVMSYFYSFYELKGSKFILISSILCCMSAPFIGAYAWILLLGRSGAMTLLLKALGI